MPRPYRIQTPLQRLAIQFSLQPQRRRYVIGNADSFHLRQKP